MDKYSLVVFHSNGEYQVLATSDCLSKLEDHRRAHMLPNTQIIKTENFKLREDGK